MTARPNICPKMFLNGVRLGPLLRILQDLMLNDILTLHYRRETLVCPGTSAQHVNVFETVHITALLCQQKKLRAALTLELSLPIIHRLFKAGVSSH